MEEISQELLKAKLARSRIQNGIDGELTPNHLNTISISFSDKSLISVGLSESGGTIKASIVERISFHNLEITRSQAIHRTREVSSIWQVHVD